MRRERVIPLIVAAAMFMEHMDSTVIATSLPAIAADIGTSPLTLKLAITSYLLSLAVFIPASGWIADRFGARTVFVTAITIFIAGSISCALSETVPQFVAARVFQGIGGAMMTPVGRLVLLRSVEKKDLVAAMTWVAVPSQVGPMVGPALGGFITTYGSWHWIFLINIPIGLIGMYFAWRYIDPIREDNPEPFDFKGFVLSGVGLAGLAFGLSTAGIPVLPWSVIIASLAIGIVSMTLYVRHARTVARPVLDFRLLRIPSLRIGMTGGFLFRVASGAQPFLLPLLLQIGFGMTPFRSGSITFVSAVGALGMKTFVTRIIRAFGFRWTMTTTSVLTGIAMASCALFTSVTPLLVVLGVLFMGGFLRSLQFTAMNALMYSDVEQAQMSRATTMVSVVMQLAVCSGVAIGAFCVEMTLLLQASTQIVASDFIPAFCAVGLMCWASALVFSRMSSDAGHQVSGRRAVANTAEDTPPETEAVALNIANDAKSERDRKAS